MSNSTSNCGSSTSSFLKMAQKTNQCYVKERQSDKKCSIEKLPRKKNTSEMIKIDQKAKKDDGKHKSKYKTEDSSKYDWFSSYPELSSEGQPQELLKPKDQKVPMISEMSRQEEQQESPKKEESNSLELDRIWDKKKELINYIHERTMLSKNKLKKWSMKGLKQKRKKLKEEEEKKHQREHLGMGIREFLMKHFGDSLKSVLIKLTDEELQEMYVEIKKDYIQYKQGKKSKKQAKSKQKKSSKERKNSKLFGEEEGDSRKTKSLNSGQMLEIKKEQ